MKPKSQIIKRIDGIKAGAGNITATGDIIVIKKIDVPKFLKSYIEIESTNDYTIAYGGAENQIIVGGYITYLFNYSQNTIPDNPQWYSSATFERGMADFVQTESGGTYENVYGTNFTITTRFLGLDRYGNYEFRFYLTIDEYEEEFIIWKVSVSNPQIQPVFCWEKIYAPDDKYPYGSIGLKFVVLDSDNNVIRQGGLWQAGFSSEAEYRAALTITYEPVTKAIVKSVEV